MKHMILTWLAFSIYLAVAYFLAWLADGDLMDFVAMTALAVAASAEAWIIIKGLHK